MSIPEEPTSDSELLPITEVERQTGIRQATLRMWERRYGFPQPGRDRNGERVYPPDQVARLHAVRRLIDQGLRPGKIFSGALEPDSALPAAPEGAVPEALRRIFALLRSYRLPELHALFQQRLLDLGLRRFVIEFMAPLSTEVGLAWRRGELPVRCQHLYTELAVAVLHATQAPLRVAGDGRPRVVLATLTGESHALGIMMVEAVMTTLELHCIQLGGDTPPAEVAAAAAETGADIVALSFSAFYPRRSMLRAVASLRASLPPDTALWVGGEGARAVSPGAGVTVFGTLAAIAPALAEWHAGQAGTSATTG